LKPGFFYVLFTELLRSFDLCLYNSIGGVCVRFVEGNSHPTHLYGVCLFGMVEMP